VFTPRKAGVTARARGARRPSREAGFSLVEVLISIAVLTVGMVSLLGVFGLAMATTMTTQEDMIAKQLANEQYESIITARNTSQLGWDDIQNSGSTCSSGTGTCGLFVNGAQSIYNAGADGIFGTSDDSAAGIAQLHEPGADGFYGDTDDVYVPLTNYQRTVLISPVTDSDGNTVPTLRAVNITVTYWTTSARVQKSYVLSSYISEFQ
jgi:prepilin-type N-terminal cleavage/methylation domain-containing protein